MANALKEEYHYTTRGTAWPVAWAVLFVGGLGLWWATLDGGDMARAWRSILISFLFFAPLSAAMVVWSPVVLISHGNWEGRIERAAMSGAFFAPASVIALGVLWAGSPHWAPWYGRTAELAQGAWLDNTYLFVRDMASLIAFWVMAAVYLERRRRDRGRLLGGFLALAYALVFSLIGFDLVMALEPRWSSSMFGGYFMMSGAYAAVAMWALVTTLMPHADPDRFHDLGRLVLASSMLTAYMMYSQLLPIWYENMPRETVFLVPRMNYSPWKWVSWGLLAVYWLGPLYILLTIWAKRTRRVLTVIAGLLVAAAWAERWWLVTPVFSAKLDLGIPEISMLAAFLAVFGFSVSVFDRVMPHMVPRRAVEEEVA